jgi:signal transduction histidine kinase
MKQSGGLSRSTDSPGEVSGFVFWDELAHDLRGPFNSILGFTDVLKSEVQGSLNDGQAEYIDLISESAHELYQLLYTALTFTRLRLRESASEAERLDLGRLLDRSVASIPTDFLGETDAVTVGRAPSEPIEVNCIVEETEKGIALLLNSAATSAGGKGVDVRYDADGMGAVITIEWQTPGDGGSGRPEAKSLAEVREDPKGIGERITSLGLLAGGWLIERQGGELSLGGGIGETRSLSIRLPQTE